MILKSKLPISDDAGMTIMTDAHDPTALFGLLGQRDLGSDCFQQGVNEGEFLDRWDVTGCRGCTKSGLTVLGNSVPVTDAPLQARQLSV